MIPSRKLIQCKAVFLKYSQHFYKLLDPFQNKTSRPNDTFQFPVDTFAIQCSQTTWQLQYNVNEPCRTSPSARIAGSSLQMSPPTSPINREKSKWRSSWVWTSCRVNCTREVVSTHFIINSLSANQRPSTRPISTCHFTCFHVWLVNSNKSKCTIFCILTFRV